MRLDSTRQAIHDALAWGYMQTGLSGITEYLVYLTKIEKSIRHNDPCVDFLEAAYICAAINSLTPHVGAWLKFCYGPDDMQTIQTTLASKLRFDLFPISTARKHERWYALCERSLEDYRLRVHRSSPLPYVLFAESMKINVANWARDWETHHNKCLDEVRQWDSDGVGRVSSMVKALRDGEVRPTEVLFDLAS